MFYFGRCRRLIGVAPNAESLPPSLALLSLGSTCFRGRRASQGELGWPLLRQSRQCRPGCPCHRAATASEPRHLCTRSDRTALHPFCSEDGMGRIRVSLPCLVEASSPRLANITCQHSDVQKAPW